jgi:D-alanyl-D-alanine carboxypeptidase
MKILILLFFFFSCSTNTLDDQSNEQALIDDYFDLIEAKDKGMGVLLITENGKETYARTYGYADVEKKINNSLDTPFHIGSISKTLTAIILLRLVEEKKLSLDQKLSDYFPKIPNAKNITLKHLLKHRSGLENFTDQKDYLIYKSKAHTQKELIAKFAKLKLQFKPGTKHEYSNTNYVLLSYVAEKVSKKTFAELIDFYIAKPLQLKHTYLYSALHRRADEALSYSFEEVWKTDSMTHETVPLGAGAIASSARDLTRIFSALFSDELISKELFLEMTDMKEHYGYGIFVVPFFEHKALGHTGGIDAYRSLAIFFPDKKTTYVHLTNASEILFNDMNLAALSLYYKKDFKLPEFKSYDLSAVDLKIYEGVYSDKSFPLKIRIFSKGKKLYAQATGQAEFLLHATDEHVFEFASAAIRMDFEPAKQLLHLTQGKKFTLVKEANSN